MPGASAESFIIRVLKIIIASAYTIGALSLVSRLRRKPDPASLKRDDSKIPSC
jgi:hypothetical protein